MDYFGFEGTLSDEIILNVLAQVPSAPSFLSLGATCHRLRDICRFEEDRYQFWRYYYAYRWKLNPEELQLVHPNINWKDAYKQRNIVAKSAVSDADDATRTMFRNLIDFPKLDQMDKHPVLESVSNFLFSLETSAPKKKKFIEYMGPHHLLHCVSSEEDPAIQAAALMILFRLAKEDDKVVRDALPMGSISILGELLNSSNADCRRVALGLLWIYCIHDEGQCLHFGRLGVVDSLIKLLYTDVVPALLCAITILCKCVSTDSIQRMRNQDILPRLIDLIDFEEHSIKCGAMRLLPQFDRSRVAALGANAKLVKVILEYHDKIESVTMMAMIVLEYLSRDEENKSQMGRDDTISCMVSLLGSEKSELQKQAMQIMSSLALLDINARKIRQQGGLDALINILDKTDLPDVQHAALYAIVDISQDIFDSSTADSLDALKRLELALPKFSEMLLSSKLHAIVRKAAASVLEICVIVLNLNPRQVFDIAKASLAAVEAALHPDPQLPLRGHTSLYNMLSTACRLLARLIENYGPVTLSGETEEALLAQVPALGQSLLSPKHENPSLRLNLGWLLTVMFASDKLGSAVCLDPAVIDALLKPLLAEERSEFALRATLLASLLTLHQKPFASQQDASIKAQSLLENSSTNSLVSFKIFSPTLFLPLLASSNVLLRTVGMWFVTSVSHSAQGRRRVKQFVNMDILDSLRQQALDSPLLQSLLSALDKNMSVVSVFA